MDNIEEYTARNMKEFQKRQKEQEDEAAAIAAAAAEQDEKDEPPPRTAAELEEEERLKSSLKPDSSAPTEDPFTSADIISNPDATPGKDLEKALDSLILMTTDTVSADDDVASNDHESGSTSQQQKSLNVDLLSTNSGNDSTVPLLELTPSHSDPIVTDNAPSDSPTLPDLLGESPPKNQPLLEPSEGDSAIPQLDATAELNTRPDLMLGDNLTSTEMPLDIATNVSYPPLDLLSSEDPSNQLVDVTQGTLDGDSLLANTTTMDSLNTNPTPGEPSNN